MLCFERSKALYADACEVLANGVSSGMRKDVTPVPLYFERANGPYYYDVDGNEFVDYTLGWGPLIAGSNNPRINAAVTTQLSKSYTLGAQHELEIALAQKLVEILPGVEQVVFSNTGSEAVQCALRLARATTGRNKVIKFEGHYHGWMNNILVSYHPAGTELGKAAPSCGGQPWNEYADTIVLPWNDLNALEAAFQEHRDEIACVITEPILVNSGSCMPNDGYLDGLIELCRAKGAISIFDEVITGFRIALGGAREYFGLTPDMSVYAKAMAGGFTMAAIGARANMFDALRDGRTLHAGTYNGTSHNLAAAIATIDLLSAPGTHERMHQHGFAIREVIESEGRANGVPLVTTGVGTAFSVHFGQREPPRDYRDTLKSDPVMCKKFQLQMLENHVLLLPEGRWYVGLTHTETELARTTGAIGESMRVMRER